MKKTTVSLLICMAIAAPVEGLRAESVWFNVEGDATNPAVNTIEVDPSPVTVAGAMRTMRIRVSRSAPRVSWDGVPYRSFVADVIINCLENSARYGTLTYYQQPAWAGEVTKTAIYGETDLRVMAFRDVVPNPTLRIIRAACQSAAVQSN